MVVLNLAGIILVAEGWSPGTRLARHLMEGGAGHTDLYVAFLAHGWLQVFDEPALVRWGSAGVASSVWSQLKKQLCLPRRLCRVWERNLVTSVRLLFVIRET